MKNDRDSGRDQVVRAIEDLWEEGCPVAQGAAEVSQVILRRWRSSARRGVRPGDSQARIRDLVDGLIRKFEPKRKLVGPLRRDYECVAQRVFPILAALEASDTLVTATESTGTASTD